MKTITWIAVAAAWLFAPMLPGIINKVKSAFAGRNGPSVFQLYRDLDKLLRKGATYSATTSFVIRSAPSLIVACMIIATMLLPCGGLRAPLAFTGDIILLPYLLGLARFATVLAALDTGSSFEGMGASREVQLGALAEPSFFLGMLVLIVQTGHFDLSGLIAATTPGVWESSYAFIILVACSWFVLLLTENSRIPVDDPNTHLELTMIHEVMVLDISGPDFAFIQYAASLKLWIFGALLVNLLFPLNLLDTWLQVPAFLICMSLIMVIVGIVESGMARLKLQKIPKILIGSAALSLISLIMKLADF